jgi:hypothetical protein
MSTPVVDTNNFSLKKNYYIHMIKTRSNLRVALTDCGKPSTLQQHFVADTQIAHGIRQGSDSSDAVSCHHVPQNTIT